VRLEVDAVTNVPSRVRQGPGPDLSTLAWQGMLMLSDAGRRSRGSPSRNPSPGDRGEGRVRCAVNS
jgi:hypothetical protein